MSAKIISRITSAEELVTFLKDNPALDWYRVLRHYGTEIATKNWRSLFCLPNGSVIWYATDGNEQWTKVEEGNLGDIEYAFLEVGV